MQQAQNIVFLPDSSMGFTAFVPKTPLTQNGIWTLNQNALLFDITLEKAEHDLAYGKHKAVANEVGWITTTVSLRTRLTTTIKEDEYTDEISSEVKTLVTQFTGLSQEEIAKVFSNYFRPINLYKLCLMRGRDNFYHNQIHIDKGILKMQKVTSLYKDYDLTNIFWSKAFLNYTMILIALFGPIIPALYLALAGFY